MAPEPISVSAVALVSGETRIVASAVGTRQELRELLAFAAEGKVKATIKTLPLESINDTFDRLRNGKVNGRVVLGIGQNAGRESFTTASLKGIRV